jgi:Gpi18-like mannosyltransferase
MWVGRDVVLPFFLTRSLLILTSYFSQYFPIWDLYPQTPNADGWLFSPHRWLDSWGRWDTYWYMDIVKHGYYLRGALDQEQSNVAFFPLYPFFVKFFSHLFPVVWQTPAVILSIGVIISNLCVIAALILFYRLVRNLIDAEVAAKSVRYLLLFPTGFFLSCFYTESLFLLLSLMAFGFALKKRWAIAAMAGALLALTRPQGVFILLPLAWQYMESCHWKLSKIRLNGLWLLTIPVGLLMFLVSLYPMTHSLTAPFDIQVTWGKEQSYPWTTLLNPQDYMPYTTPIDQMVLVGSLVIALIAFRSLPSKSYGIYALALLLPTLFTGILRSSSRYSLVVFPLFMVMGQIAQRYPLCDRWLPALFLTIQVLLMAAWCQFYWVA